jgi:hypothetical protein
MSRSSIFLPTATHSWSAEEIRKLKAFAQEGRSLRDIARALKRTESAIRNKAGMHGISLSAAAINPGFAHKVQA